MISFEGATPRTPQTIKIPARTTVRGRAVRLYGLLLLFLACRAFGNLALAWGTKHLGEQLAVNPLAYVRALLDPTVAGGVAMLIAGLLTRLALLSVADLSFVLPMTALGYVISGAFGKIFLHEDVSWKRWLGLALVFAGVAIVGSTSANTTEPPQEKLQ